MTRRVLPRALALALALPLALGACSGDDGAGSESANGTQVESGDQDRSLGRVDASAEDRHPNGAHLRVSSVELRERSVAVDVSLVNGHTQEIRLNGRGLWLVDEQGNAYAFDEPQQNANLTVGSGEELTGTLVFLGSVADDAGSLTLKTNRHNPEDNIDTSSRGRNDTNPEFLLEGLQLP